MDEIKEIKECRKCLVVKTISEFYSNRRICKECRNNQCKEHYNINKEKIIQKSIIWQKNNKSKANESSKKYYIKNIELCRKKNRCYYKSKNKVLLREYRRKYCSNKRKLDPLYNLSVKIRNNINNSIKRSNFIKNSKTTKILGCDFEFFKSYIESQFIKDMSWSNIHLDHIKPMCTASTEENVLQLNHYTNFQPLFIFDNLSKGKKLVEKQLRLL